MPKTPSAPVPAPELLALGLIWDGVVPVLPGDEALLVNFDHQLFSDCLEGAADESESVMGKKWWSRSRRGTTRGAWKLYSES
jgi:hypothetical protein